SPGRQRSLAVCLRVHLAMRLMSASSTSPPDPKAWEAFLLSTLPLEGAQVRLRPWTEADVHRRRALSGLDAPWRRWNAPYEPPPTETKLNAIYQRVLQRVGRGETMGRGRRIAIADRDTDVYIGEVTWVEASFAALNWPSLGIAIHDDAFWGRGRGTEALGLWADLLFRGRGCHRADLRTWSGNHRMCAVAQKLGFIEEARFREAVVVGGVRYDSVVFGILRRDWAARHPDGFQDIIRGR
ncbi:MAG: GNAT family protein, partial [Myxococcota bacterium]